MKNLLNSYNRDSPKKMDIAIFNHKIGKELFKNDRALPSETVSGGEKRKLRIITDRKRHSHRMERRQVKIEISKIL